MYIISIAMKDPSLIGSNFTQCGLRNVRDNYRNLKTNLFEVLVIIRYYRIRKTWKFKKKRIRKLER